MINDIIYGITKALNQEFEGVPVYAEPLKQGFKEPCFFVYCTESTNRIYLGKRYLAQNAFCVTYFPKLSNRQKEECNDVAERLCNCLECVDIDDAMGGQIRGTNMKHTVSDGVLVFTLNYDAFYYKNELVEVMESLEKQDITAKG